jgi:uncharacterized protein YbaR (Trm112 family)
MFDKRLLTILACPICKGPLVYHKKHKELWCKFDRLAYPIVDDIPVMIQEEGRFLTVDECKAFHE